MSFLQKAAQSNTYGLLALSGVLVLLFGTTTPPVLTGDEPRYLAYSYAFFAHFSFSLTDAEWASLYQKAAGLSQVPAIASGGVVHPIYLDVILSPIAYYFSIAGLRVVSFLAGICGLSYLLRLARECTSATPAVATATGAVTIFSIPILPHLRLYYMEVFIFAFILAGWYRIHRAPKELKSDLVTAAILLSLPFIHLRASVVGAVLYLIFLWHTYRQADAESAQSRLTILVVAAVAALCVLVALNFYVYGSVAGSVTTAHPPLTPDEAFWTVAMQWFNVRHGLMAYAPIWLLGYAGLAVGALRGRNLAREGLLLVLVAAVTGVGVNPGESWPARFWVLSVPMLGIGLCFWLQSIRSLVQWAITFILGGLTLLNTIVYWWNPNSFLANRQASVTYQLLFDFLFAKSGGFHPGLVLPVEIPGLIQTDLARNLMLVALVSVAMLVWSVIYSTRYAWGPLLVLLIGADVARVRQVPPSEFVIATSAEGFVVTMKVPLEPASYFQLGPLWEVWSGPPDWPLFDVEATAAPSDSRLFPTGDSSRWTMSANQVISAVCRNGLSRLNVNTTALAGAEAKFAVSGVKVYESRSLVRRITAAMMHDCTS
ncbi:hypothetical protein [uncultured Bradyrhizobium sp.]|uniref:hypothetical protein n=1 Tax=uncultured Bradyrhizobium sp. TaxID=199684 RepID=UPI0026095CEA|nr:hypothetical protein [uncultured Bradyrhizobium sp.]